jgi:hypothetical protein
MIVLVQSNKEGSSNNENGPEDKTATGSAEFVVDLELADEVEIPPYRKRRGDVKSDRSVEDDAAGKCAHILKEVNAIEKDVGSEDAHVTDHRGSREGIDLTQTGQDDRSAEKCSRKVSTSKSPSKASGRQCGVSIWEERLRELTDYRKIHGHCNVPWNYSENAKLAKWVRKQRSTYKLHLEGNTSPMTLSRIQGLESLGFEWKPSKVCVNAWEDRLSELADYRKIRGHCNVSKRNSVYQAG